MRMSEYNVAVCRSRRRSVSIKINDDLTVEVRAPLGMTDREIESFVTKHSGWIDKHMAKIRESQKTALPKFTTEELKALKKAAAEKIPERVKFFAPVVGADYGKITIRSQLTRWGSCSAKGDLSFNCLLMLCPAEVLDYVVVHELCHRKQMNHSAAFWKEVEQVLPDYKSRRKWLKDNGGGLINRIK